jgi:THO complex subunit 2
MLRDFYVHLLKKSPWKPVQGVPKQVLAQILGFKFRFYARSDQALNNTPVQLYWTAAVLIREGLVALDDLYPHLDPVDESSLKKELFEYLSGLQKRASKAGRFAPTKVHYSSHG